jgi:hypothetical protein
MFVLSGALLACGRKVIRDLWDFLSFWGELWDFPGFFHFNL